jgi:hypothetical protein
MSRINANVERCVHRSYLITILMSLTKDHLATWKVQVLAITEIKW